MPYSLMLTSYKKKFKKEINEYTDHANQDKICHILWSQAGDDVLSGDVYRSLSLFEGCRCFYFRAIHKRSHASIVIIQFNLKHIHVFYTILIKCILVYILATSSNLIYYIQLKILMLQKYTSTIATISNQSMNEHKNCYYTQYKF